MPHISDYVDAPYLHSTARLLSGIKRRSYELMHVSRGQRVLDVGCGPGVDTLSLADEVGPTGRVVGLDRDQTMVHAAGERAETAGVSGWVWHQCGDARSLPFASDSFDACRSERLFQHLDRPIDALAEMVRVTRRGGWILAVDTDWGSLSIDHPEIDIERRLARVLPEKAVRNGYAGRHLFRWFRQQRLVGISVEPMSVCITQLAVARQLAGLDMVEPAALASGAVTRDELRRWHSGLALADAESVFFGSASVILVAGRKS